MSSKHTQGPWTLEKNKHDWLIHGAVSKNGGRYCITGIPKDEEFGRLAEDDANAERIVACVNGCAPLADPSVIPELVLIAKMARGFILVQIDECKDLHRNAEARECLDALSLINVALKKAGVA